jgi:hypothetical protein
MIENVGLGMVVGLVWFGLVWFGLVWFGLICWLVGWLMESLCSYAGGDSHKDGWSRRSLCSYAG